MKRQHPVTQFDKSDVEYAGLVVRLPRLAYADYHQLSAGDDQQAAGEEWRAAAADIAAIRWTIKASTCCSARKPALASSESRGAERSRSEHVSAAGLL